ncbi:hypothetical protein K9M59_02930 [Candidatus Gracilibacteria bacterium]|nr:hypothetical protein [Candidatus Gracilibacteria bacterium]MCF7819286.1 hypothetical protein [Candidatus Gracilibacteria bacterium]
MKGGSDVSHELFPSWNTINYAELQTLNDELAALMEQQEEQQGKVEECHEQRLSGFFDEYLEMECGIEEQKLVEINLQIEEKRAEISQWEANPPNINENAEPIKGVIGVIGDQRFLPTYLPRLIDILLKFVAPIVLVMFLYSGIRFIYAGDDEEELSKAKQFFTYALMGVLFIVLSYSVIKSLYFIFSTVGEHFFLFCFLYSLSFLVL